MHRIRPDETDHRKISFVFVALLSVLVATTAIAEPPPGEPGSFYKYAPVFSTRANEKVSLQTIARFGPVGMAIDLEQPAFQMKINMIEKGSPAEAAKLKAGLYIDSINGQKLKNIDPRIQLTNILNEAEAKDGVLKFVVKVAPDAKSSQKVIVRVPVLGAYSKSWPLKCDKSKKIVRNFGDYLAETEWTGACELNGPALLFLVSTGEEKDLATARKWIAKTIEYYKTNPAPFKNWRLGYGGVPLAEYYLRTGDKAILPVIQKYADLARKHHYLGGWAHGGTGLFPYMGGGHMNAAGTHVLTFLLLAKECGVGVDEKTLQSSLSQMFRFAGRGLNPYGDGRPEEGFVDNGKTGVLTLAMAAAAALTPEGEKSLYAQARDVCALKSFYTTPWMNHGHTGGGVGEVWRSMAMGMLYEKRPTQYRSFMEMRKWFYDLSRRHDGSFGILGGGRYDGRSGTTPGWGHTMGLSYTVPRKTLQITGAPKTKHCRSYQLPKRPWGTPADDEFLSLLPAADRKNQSPRVKDETLWDNCARFMLMKMQDPKITVDEVRSFAHHQEQSIRRAAAQCAAGIVPQYMRITKPKKARFPELVTELLESHDARVRYAGVYAVTMLPEELLSKKNVTLLTAMIRNPKESWFVVDRAMRALGQGKPEMVAPVVGRLVELLNHDEWWLRSGALSALMVVITDKEHSKKIFPALSRCIAENQRYNTLGPLRGLGEKLKGADPAVQKAAVEMLGKAYSDFSQDKQTREVPNLDGETRHLDNIARYLAACPGGLEKLFEVSQKRFPTESLHHAGEFLGRQKDAGPAIQKALRPIILDELIPAHVARHYGPNGVQAGGRGGYAGGRNDAIDQLVGLYAKAGIKGYDWQLFGPDLKKAEWWYLTFDPIAKEQVKWDRLIVRSRRVTLPKGSERWNAADFDPTKAGWKKGRAAFGQYNGKIPADSDRCKGPGCWCGAKVNTLWDKEVLMFQGNFTLPKAKEGHRYRLRVNDGDHVGCGGGYEVYINGKRMIGSGRPPRRGEGGLPKGIFISREWINGLKDGKVTIAVKSFIRYNRSYQRKPSSRVPQGKISVHFEEMKMPPYSHEQVLKAAMLVPMLSSKWQARQFPDAGNMVEQEGTDDDGKFLFDGKYKANAAVIGSWQLLGRVKEIKDFRPGMDLKALERTVGRGRAPFRELTIKENGRTDHPARLWSGNTVMNLNRFEALRMVVTKIDGTDYLFVEAGEFHGPTGIPYGWMTPWCVMRRAEKK